MTDAGRAAHDALAIAREEPAAALDRADEVIAATESTAALAVAHFAKGLAHRALANGADSTHHLERAAEFASADSDLLGEILRSLAFNYAQAGDHRRADETIRNSILLLAGQAADLSRLQQAFMLLMRGDHRAALPVLDAAVDGFSQSGDDEYLELTLFNRALVYTEFGEYDASLTDLERAYEIGIRLEHRVSAADAALHLSQVLGWRDDVPGAMRWHARSVRLRAAAGAANPVADTEHAFILIQARLMREAEATLRDAIPRLVAAGGNEAIAIVGRLLLADVLADRGDHTQALREIELAASASPVDSRWRFDIAAARHRVQISAGAASPELLRAMMKTADEMEQNGELHAAALERFRAVQVALAAGDPETAQALGEDARSLANRGPLWLQVQAWTALARIRFAAGDRRGAAAAVRAGMRRLARYRAGIGATDLRIHAREWGSELADIGLRLAIQSGSPARVFDWSEQLRMAAAPSQTTNPRVQTALADLRKAAAAVRLHEGEPDRALRRRLQTAEQRVSALTRQAAGGITVEPAIGIATLQERLAGRTLVQFVEADGMLRAVVIAGDSRRLVALADTATVTQGVDHLRLAAERIARPATSPVSRSAAIESATTTARSLAGALIDPLCLASPRVVLIPAGVLNNLPWTMIVDRPVEVAPSATAWDRAAQQPRTEGRLVVAAGPDLAHAASEADYIAAHEDAAITTGTDETLRELATASAAHFACHARARIDNPMFSSLVLADGEITLHDIERLPRSPGQVTLAACSGGSTLLTSGEEIVSLAGSFLSLGARTVVAPLFTVSDGITATVMRALRDRLRDGADAASALYALSREPEPQFSFTAGSFITFGTV